MNKHLKRTKLAGALAALGLMSLIGSAHAALLAIDFTKAGAFSGTSPTLPSDPNEVFARAIFDDQGGAGMMGRKPPGENRATGLVTSREGGCRSARSCCRRS